MIDIVERPSETGKLINRNHQDWNTAVRIQKALSREEHALGEHGQYDTPLTSTPLARSLNSVRMNSALPFTS